MDSGGSGGGTIDAAEPETIAEEMVGEGVGGVAELTADRGPRQGGLSMTGVKHGSGFRSEGWRRRRRRAYGFGFSWPSARSTETNKLGIDDD